MEGHNDSAKRLDMIGSELEQALDLPIQQSQLYKRCAKCAKRTCIGEAGDVGGNQPCRGFLCFFSLILFLIFFLHCTLEHALLGAPHCTAWLSTPESRSRC